MRFRLLGHRSLVGGGVLFGEFADALRSLGGVGEWVDELDPADWPGLENAVRTGSADDVNIWFWQHPAIGLLRGTNVVWAIFESDRLPHDYLQMLNTQAHVIWVPSHWGRDVLVANGVDRSKIDVVPEGVNIRKFHPFFRKPFDPSKNPFKFLAVGKFEERKAYPTLIDAFRLAFGNDPNVRLIIKADYFKKADQKKDELQSLVEANAASNVDLVWGEWSSDAMLGLYSFADAFVFPSRAEGWGLPLIEALACGLPVASTYYSGHSEFLQRVRNEISVIEHDLVPIEDDEFLRFWPMPDGSIGHWAAPNTASLVAALRQIRDNPEYEFARAQVASAVVRGHFDWVRAVETGLRALGARQALRLPALI